MNEALVTGAPEAPAESAPVDTQVRDSAPLENAEQQSEPTPPPKDGTRSLVSRVGHVTRQKEAAIREAAQWRERAEALERQYAGNGQQQQAPQRESQFDPAQVMAQAKQAAAFDLKCNAVAEKGKAIPGFNDALSSLAALGLDQASLEVLIDSDDAPKVIAHLGTHLDEAAEILSKSPAAMARALAKLEHTLTQQPAVSNAPNPLKAVRSGGSVSGPAVGTKAWFDAQNKADAERRKR